MLKTATLVHSLAPSCAAETKVLDSAKGVVQALVSVTGNRDSDGDVVVPGASARGLATVTPKGVWHHDWTTPVAKTLEVTEVYPGDPSLPADLLANGYGALRVTAQFNLDSERGREAFATVKFFGPEQEWSVGYEVDDFYLGGGGATRQSEALLEQAARHSWFAQAKELLDGDAPTRFITAWTIYEFSPVLFGANRLTRTEEAKGLERVADVLERVVVRLDALEAKAAGQPQVLASNQTTTSLAMSDGTTIPATITFKVTGTQADGGDLRKTVAEVTGDDTKDDGEKPWHVEERDGEFCVVKDDDGEVEGCHATREAAEAQMAALYAAETSSLDDGDEEEKGDAPEPHAFDGDPEHPHRCAVCGAGAQRPWHKDSELEELEDSELEGEDEKGAKAAIDALVRVLEDEVNWLAGDKAGRVQARRNVERLRRAMTALGEMLDEIAAGDDEDAGKAVEDDPYAVAARLLADTYRSAFGT